LFESKIEIALKVKQDLNLHSVLTNPTRAQNCFIYWLIICQQKLESAFTSV